MKKLLVIVGISLSMLAPGDAMAGHRHKDRDHHYRDSGRVVSARVVKVKPIYETVRIARPETNCRKHRGHRRHHRSESYTPTVLGALVGGVVGNQFGSESGRTAMTVAGSLLGASLGNDVGRHGRHKYRDHECQTVTYYDTREELVGYRVKYRYKGARYWTRMDHHPGKRIRVRVDVRPVRH